MNLNNFETKLNTDNYTKDDVRRLLNYSFRLKTTIMHVENELNEALEDLKMQIKASNDIGDIDSSNYLLGKIQGVEIALDVIFNIRD